LRTKETTVAKFSVILPAAGRSRRFKDKHYKKVYAMMANRAIWIHAAERFINRDDVIQTILIIAPEDREDFNFKFASNVAILGIEVVEGGAERSDSVANALAKVKPEADFIAVHDAARPCMVDPWVDKIFEAGEKHGAAMFAIPVNGTLKRVANHKIEETVDRTNLWEAQTPQVFRRELLLEAYEKRGDFQATDDAQLVERLGHEVTIVHGSPMNMKITTKEDLRFAEQTLKALPKPKLGPMHPFADDDMWR